MDHVNDVCAEATAAGNDGTMIGPVNNDASSKNTPCNDKNSCTYPMVTGEKKMMTSSSNDDPQKYPAANNSSNKNDRQYSSSFTVTCPDGSIVQLSAPPSKNNDRVQEDSTTTNNDDKRDILTTSQIVIGRGKYGIPSSASHVSRQACVLRVILEEDDTSVEKLNQYALELVVLGSQPCRITRQSSAALTDTSDGQNPTKLIFAKSISQIIAEKGNDFSPSSRIICHGDVIEPCDRPMECNLDEAKEKGCYHPFTIHFTANSAVPEKENMDASSTLFTEASRKIEAAAVQLDERKKMREAKEEDEPKETSQDTVNVKSTMETTGKDAEMIALENDCDLVKSAGVQSDDRKKTREVGKEEELKENSQDTVDAKSTMETGKDVETENDVEMKASENDCSVLKTADEEKCDVTAVDGTGKDETAVTLTTIICGSMGISDSTAVKLDKSLDDANIEAKMNCSSDKCMKGGYEEEGSAKATSLDVTPNTVPTTSVAESSKELPASPTKERESSSASEESSEEEEEFDDPRQEIIDILQEIDAPGTFAVGGSCGGKLIMPGLVVDGIGPIGLPLSNSQAKELANRCEQAPFGCGSETIVDKSVRDTFQLAPDSFKITNPAWNGELDTITKSVCQDLGVQHNLKVEARLYKLLLYEEGSFFAPHRDSEKEEGMFGTLVIVLPSQFTGGELVVKHKGDTQTFKQEGLSAFGSQYAAFYADCKHELKKVTSGHRLCVVFNLVKCGLGMLPKAADNSSLMKRLNSAASQWAADYDGRKIVLMTDHLYTPAGIKNGSGSAKYKGADAYVADLLQSAINKGADIDYDHGTLSLSESGYAEDDGYGCWGRGDYSWVEATDRHLSLNLSSYGGVSVEEEEEVIPEDYFENLEPDDETFEPTGNEGIQAERQYADTEAIVVWPRSQRWMIVTNNDTSRMCSYLVKACSKGTSDSEPLDECLQKAKSLIPRVTGTADIVALVKSIKMIGDVSLAKDFLSSYLKNSERSIDAIFDHIQTLSDICGTEAITSLIVDSINTTRFVADPTGTANFVLKYLDNFGKKVAISQQQRDDVIAAFTAAIRPPEKNSSRTLKKSLDKFPLSAILALFVDEKPENRTLARCVLEGYVWLSCLEVKRYSYYSSSATKPSDGPVLVASASRSITKLCNCFGWAEYKDVLVDAVEKLCERDKSDIALALLDSLAQKDEDKSDRSDICSKLAAAACDKILTSLQAPFPNDATRSTRLAVCKKVVVSIGKFCSPKAAKFVEVAKSLDFDSVLFPLVSDPTLRSNSCDSVIHSLNLLTQHCAHVLKIRLSVELDNVTIWSLPNAHLSNNSNYSGFLRGPCKQVLDWQVRKADHPGFMTDLRALIRSGDVRAESYQPGGRGLYHFKITKLKSRKVPASSLAGMKCSCTSGSRYSHYSSYRSQSTSSNCPLSKHKATASKYQDDLKKMNVIKSLLPSVPAVLAPALAKQPAARSLREFDVLFTTPKLGLKLNFVNGKDIVVKEVTATAPNAHLIKAGDFVVGFNGKRFKELGVTGTGTKSYEQALTKMKEAQRPVSLIFERQITASNVEETTRKRPAATTSSVAGVGMTSVAGADAQIQPVAKKAKAAEIIDLT